MKRAFLESLKLSNRDLAILFTSTLLAGTIYLLASHIQYRIGFPLDDSWIHQTYARNLAEHGEWSFRVGIQSAGSTSPLWSMILAVGFLIGISPYIWTYTLGLIILFGMGILTESIARRKVQSYTPQIPWVGLFFIVEWHLLWAAMSGMETLLHGLIVTGVLSALMMRSRRYLALGLITGLSVWVRPDGLTLLAPLALAVILFEADTPARLRGLMRVFIGFGAVFLLYIFFNLLVGGTPMPNTFYAKQAEYIEWQNSPITRRLGELLLQLLAGPSVLILPGIYIWVSHSIRIRSWGNVLALIWSVSYMFMYVLRLPMYQHGRYIMPAMPALFLVGLLGVLHFSSQKTFKRYQWLVNGVWFSGLFMVSLLFIFLGARFYSDDVVKIETEMVDTAIWVKANLPEDALIALHDIGAIGYFTNQPIIDLAGLVSPEVVPFIRDEARLLEYLDAQKVDYLIAFPGLYDEMTVGKPVVFSTGSQITHNDFVHMTIFQWK